MQLTPLDYTIIVVYFVISLGIGLAFSGRAGKSMVEYFISGRSLPWWLAGTSMVATTFAADTPLAVTGLVAKHGLAGNWVWWAFALGGMITVFMFTRLWRRSEVLSDVELIELRYGGKPAAFLRGFRAIYVALILNPIIIGWVTGAMLKVLKVTVLAGVTENAASAQAWLSPTAIDWLIIGVCLAAVGIYATLAGLWGVSIADFFQFFAAMAGCIGLAIVAVRKVGGMGALQEKVAANFPGGEQAFAYVPDFHGTNPWMPMYVFLILLLMQWWATWYPGAEPGGGGYVVQRMASCRNEKHALLATLWFQVAHYCVRPWPWLIVAFVAMAMFPGLRDLDDPGLGFPMVMREVAPAGLAGLLLVTFFAAFMSTISTQMNWGASYLVNDVYKRFMRPKADEAELTLAARLASVLMLLVGGVVAAAMSGVSVDEAWKWLLALGGGTGAVFMLRWYWWRISAWTEIAAMAASLVFFAVVPRVINHGVSEWGWQIEENSRETVVLAVVTALTITTWLIVTFVTPPETPEKLEAFYRKIRPGGPGWGPVARKLPGVEADSHLGLSLVAALLAAAMVYLTLPGVGLLIFGRYGEAGLCLGGAAVCAVLMGLAIRKIGWHRIV